jgi:hypothetical protein
MSKLLKELQTIYEDVGPDFVIVATRDQDEYDLAATIFKKFGYKDQGPASGFITQAEFDKRQEEGNMLPPDRDILDSWGVFAKTKPKKTAVVDKLENGDFIGNFDS